MPHQQRVTPVRTPQAESDQILARLGTAPVMEALRAEIKRFASQQEMTILILGENGTGKEMVARAIHKMSPRCDNPFVPINCSAISEELAESEFFGHVRGAFTGAINKEGLFRSAQGGTLFLDELGELSPPLQAKLLRAIQEKEVTPVGTAKPISVDVRLLAATNRDLRAQVHEGHFREDLFYRLAVGVLEVPPLRDRGGDIVTLAEGFLEELAKSAAPKQLSEDAKQWLMKQTWPGNVRQLRNLMEVCCSHLDAGLERALLEAEYNKTDLHKPKQEVPESSHHDSASALSPADAPLTKEKILEKLKEAGGGKTNAALLLGIDRKTLFNWIKRYRIKKEDYEPSGLSGKSPAHAADKTTAQVQPTKQKEGTLPPVPPLVIGRDVELRQLKDQLCAPTDTHRVQVITAVRGWPGVGKTTLAAKLAHDADLAVHFPDGVLWASLGPAPNVLSELATWGRALGSAVLEKAKNLEEATGLLNRLLDDRKMLLIVDDVWQEAHAIPFRGGPHCAQLVTTRHSAVAEALAPTDGDVFVLGVLSDAESMELLEQLAPKVVERYRPQCEELGRILEGLPLAIQVAGRLLKTEATRQGEPKETPGEGTAKETGWSVPDLLAELGSDSPTRLLVAKAPMVLAQEATETVAALLQKSTDRLEPEIRDRFASLAPFAPKPAEFDVAALRAVWFWFLGDEEVDAALAEAETKRMMSALIDRGLLEPTGDGRFWMHALLVAHARSLCEE